MLKKILTVDPEKCTGCRLCEIVCSVKHNGVSNPGLSRIRIIKWDAEGFYLPVHCQQCQDAPCMAVCPKEAIYRDEALDCVKIDYDLCIGCKMCVAACPFGAMGYNPQRGLVFKCDFCQGDPQCTRFCDTKAIEYVDATNVQRARMRKSAAIFLGAMYKRAG